MFVDIGLRDYLVHPYTLLFLLGIPSLAIQRLNLMLIQ
jgi:hypothetical protein